MKPYWLLLAAMICAFAPGCSGGGGAAPEEETATEAEADAELTDDEAAMEEAAGTEGSDE